MSEIQQRLNCVHNDDSHWRQKLRNINTTMSTYENTRRRNPGGTYEHLLHGILPKYWEVFHTHNISRRKSGDLLSRENDNNLLPCYDVGIFLVGFSSLPIVLSLAEIDPKEKIYFIYSSDTRDVLDEIHKRIEAMLQHTHSSLVGLVGDTILKNWDDAVLEIGSPSNPVETFKRIKNVIDEVGDKRIALDITGGKKTMIGGAFTAGSIFGFGDSVDMFYVDSLEYNVNRGRPEWSTEFLSQLENPYDVYNVQTVQQAEKLFEKHNYEAAAELLESVKDKLEIHAIQYGLEKEKNETVNHHRQANCYYLWDAFYYDKAKNGKNRHNNSWGYNQKHMRAEIDVLDILANIGNRLFTDEASIIHYAADRYQNAIRRKDSGKLDDAIVRFAQVIEMLCIYKIHQIARDNYLYNEQCNQVVTAPYKWKITPLIHFLFGKICRYSRAQNQYYTISDANQLLNITDYDYNDVDEIINLIESRHGFIHFTEPMRQFPTEINAQDLKNLAEKFLRNFSCAYRQANNWSFDELIELHEFRRLK